MLEVAAARGIVLQRAKPLPAEITALMTTALGQVLAQDVAADIDSPPFDKSMMDGYALRTCDLTNGFARLSVTEEVIAGGTTAKVLQASEAIRIYTGAPIPAGADAVVMQERTTLTGATVTVNDSSLALEKNIIRRGAEMKAGEVVAKAGTLLTPSAFGLFATVGKTSVMTVPRPKVAVVATGNELVEPARTPRAGQIRNSNGPMLMAQAASAGALPRYLGIATDDEPALRSFIAEGLEISNVLLLAGGVSAGRLDLVPKVLADLGVTVHFHKVRMKPGKPLLFGTKGNTLVFGLPGNPVSAYVGFELFVRPALAKLAGLPERTMAIEELPLTAPLAANHDRPTYHPATVSASGVTPLPWFGSADLRALLAVEAFIVLPEGEVNSAAGNTANVLRLAH